MTALYIDGWLSRDAGVVWRCDDSRTLRAVLGIPLCEATTDHSSLTKISQRLPLDVHQRVFVLGMAAEKKLLWGSQW